MVVNFHTLVVHFPVAFLTLYSILEMSKFWTKKDFWLQIRRINLYLGVLSGFIAIFFGSILESEFSVKFPKLFEMHETFATATIWIFLILAIVYIIIQYKELLLKNKYLKTILPKFDKIINFIYNTKFTILLAVIGLICLTITGALGGAMVSGPNVDPIVTFVYNLLIK